MRSASRTPWLVLLGLALAGCPPKTLVLPTPKVDSGPLEQQLAARDVKLVSIKADAVIRMRLPEGMDGAPGGKVHAVVLAAARPDRARLEILTPLGTPGATLLLAGGQLQVYQPLQNRLLKGPLDSPGLEAQSPLPLPLKSLPALLRGSVTRVEGTVTERAGTDADPESGKGATRVLEVRGEGGAIAQRVVVDVDGGYPVEDVRYDEKGEPSLTVQYLEYGGVQTGEDVVSFPQKVKASMSRPEGVATLEVSLTNLSLNPALAEDAFTLDFDGDRPPRVEEFP